MQCVGSPPGAPSAAPEAAAWEPVGRDAQRLEALSSCSVQSAVLPQSIDTAPGPCTQYCNQTSGPAPAICSILPAWAMDWDDEDFTASQEAALQALERRSGGGTNSGVAPQLAAGQLERAPSAPAAPDIQAAAPPAPVVRRRKLPAILSGGPPAGGSSGTAAAAGAPAGAAPGDENLPPARFAGRLCYAHTGYGEWTWAARSGFRCPHNCMPTHRMLACPVLSHVPAPSLHLSLLLHQLLTSQRWTSCASSCCTAGWRWWGWT